MESVAITTDNQAEEHHVQLWCHMTKTNHH